jgi:CubicO group peptidase (beta-lactamase class C family)
MSVGEYAQQELFGPIGIDQVEWWQDAEGHTLTYCCLDMPSRDFARMGLLFLNDGAWGDEQVVPAHWIAESLTPSPAYVGYGYQWWLIGRDHDELPDDTYAAQGHDGQFIYVIPSLDLVVVRNGVYDKFDGPPVAEPNLYGRYPSDSRGTRLGTMLPENGWDEAAFLVPIIESIQDV